jgi:L-amino acid N-acyltransferase YncA
VIIRQATEQDWPLIYPIYAAIMAEGKTYPFPQGQSLDEARPWWIEQPPGQTVVAVSGGVIAGSAKMGPTGPAAAHTWRRRRSWSIRPARARAPAARWGKYVLDWCRQMGFASIQFNAVVESNAPAVHLWQALGFQIIGAAPASFDHPEHGLVGLHIIFRHL